METANSAELWREKTERLKEQFKNYSTKEIADFTRNASGALLRKERFVNSYKGTHGEPAFETLHDYLEESMREQGSLVLIPMQVGLLEANALSVSEFVEYLHETILFLNDIEDTTGNTTREQDENTPEVEDEFNALLDEVEELAEYEDYEAAIEKLDKAFALAETEPLLIYDRTTMINNRAFYNCRLGNYEEALADVDLAISEEPNDGLLYHTKAEIFAEMGVFSKALEFIDKAILVEDTQDKHEFRKSILERI